MAGTEYTINVYDKTGNNTLYSGMARSGDNITIGQILGYSWNSSGDVTALSKSIGGTPLLNSDIINVVYPGFERGVDLYDVTPEPEPETVTGFFLDGQEYVLGGSGGTEWGDITGTLSNQTDLNTALSGKQNTLTTQTAYTTKGTATKVPTITTNTLGQVTAITETNITYPSQVSDTAYGNGWDGQTTTAPSQNAVYDKIASMDTTISNKANATDIGDATITFTQGGVSKGAITTNQAAAETIALDAGFNPGGTATTGYVVTKTAGGYEWKAPSGGDVVVSSDADNVLTTGAGLRAGDENDLPANPNPNNLYFCY